jgi:hypothetical protein
MRLQGLITYKVTAIIAYEAKGNRAEALSHHDENDDKTFHV